MHEKAPAEEDYESENPEALCGGSLWDSNQEWQQLEAWTFTKMSSCELSFEKVEYSLLFFALHVLNNLVALMVSSYSHTRQF